jgi:hypothetical protein
MMEVALQKIANFMIDNIRVVVYRLIATLAQIYFQVVKTKNVKLSTVVNVFFDDLERQRTCIKGVMFHCPGDPRFNLVIRYQKEHLIHSKAPTLYAR